MIGPKLRAFVALFCSELLIVNLAGCGGHRAELPTVKPVASVFEPLQEELKKPYLTLFEIAPTLEYSETQIARMRDYLNQAQDFCVGRFEASAKNYQSSVEEAQKGLKSKITDDRRHALHCTIQ